MTDANLDCALVEDALVFVVAKIGGPGPPRPPPLSALPATHSQSARSSASGASNPNKAGFSPAGDPPQALKSLIRNASLYITHTKL